MCNRFSSARRSSSPPPSTPAATWAGEGRVAASDARPSPGIGIHGPDAIDAACSHPYRTKHATGTVSTRCPPSPSHRTAGNPTSAHAMPGGRFSRVPSSSMTIRRSSPSACRPSAQVLRSTRTILVPKVCNSAKTPGGAPAGRRQQPARLARRRVAIGTRRGILRAFPGLFIR